MSTIKAVLFDMDGTLINTIDDLANSMNYVLEKRGYKTHTTDEYKYMVGNGMRLLVERAMPKDVSEDEITSAFEEFLDYYNKHAMDLTAPYDKVPEVISELKNRGYKIAVVTNKAEPSAKMIVKEMFCDCFDVVIGQRPELPTKPDPAAAHLAMDMLGVTPEECCFIGDSGVDIETAVNSGALPIGVLWGFRKEDELRAAGAKIVVSTPLELLEVIK